MPVVAIYPWSFAENESGTSEAGVKTAQTLLQKLFEERAGMVTLGSGACVKAWMETAGEPWAVTIEDPAQQPQIPNAQALHKFGRAAKADYVCAGRLSWHVKSVWAALGPKTRVDATVDCRIIDVQKEEVVLDVKQFNSNTGRAEQWYETAGSLLLTWGITLFSGGPKTPHIQKAAVKAIGGATDPFISTTGQSHRKIGDGKG